MVVLWVLINLLVVFGLSNMPPDPTTRNLLLGLSQIVLAFSTAVLLLSIYLYMAAKLVVTVDGLQVLRYQSLFRSIQSTVTWADVEEITVTEGGILKSLFNVGTILVQTSSAQPNLALNYIPNVDQWRDYIAQQAHAAD